MGAILFHDQYKVDGTGDQSKRVGSQLEAEPNQKTTSAYSVVMYKDRIGCSCQFTKPPSRTVVGNSTARSPCARPRPERCHGYFFAAFSCCSRIAARALRLPPSLGPFGTSGLPLTGFVVVAGAVRCRLDEIASINSRRNCSAMRSSAAWSSLVPVSASGSSYISTTELSTRPPFQSPRL